MSNTKPCPKCGALLPDNAPSGICPKCLMQAGLQSESADGSAPEMNPTILTSGFVPPNPEDLQRHFPQLEILELLGKGGMGAVYKARQPGLDRLVAVKILPPEFGTDRAFAERFTREARALARLSHQNIVSVFDFGQADGQFYFIMEYVDGTNLRQLIEAGRLKPKEALAIVPQICEALQFAHDEEIVHRDIKPENILLDKQGRVKIADFGLAKLLGKAPTEFTLTGTQQVMGTLHYMAPEQMKGSRAVDHRADIYSLGVVFYEMLTGELPIGRFEPPSKKVQVDVRLDEVVLRSLENEPGRRYQHASDVKTHVDTICSSRPSVAPTATPPPSKADGEFDLDDVRRAVQTPANGISLTAILSFVPGVLVFVGDVMDVVPAGPLEAMSDVGISTFAISLFGALSVLAIPAALLMMQGALRMQGLASYQWARLGAVLAMLPWTPAWLLGLPIGIWALHVLRQPKVRAAFGEPSSPLTPPSHSGRAAIAAATGFGGHAKQVRRLAAGLILTGSIKSLVGILLVVSNIPLEWRTDAREFATALSLVVLGAVIASGGWLTWGLRKYVGGLVAGGLALSALLTPAIGQIALGPWALDLTSVPVGIWALVTLTRPSVADAFRRQEEGVKGS